MGQEWQAGAAEYVVTPPLGVFMTGYGNRPGPANARLDELYVRALAISLGESGVILLSVDNLCLDVDLIARIRNLVHWELGLPSNAVLINCSHTHAGPAAATLRGMGDRDEAYCSVLCRWIVSAARLAWAQRRPATLRFGTAESDIGINRRQRGEDGAIRLGENPDGIHDPTVSVLRVDGADGGPIACWFSHAMHPVVMGNQNRGLSAEWPGAAVEALRQAIGQGCIPLFAQGCAGDINPRGRGDHEAVVQVGKQLAEAALEAYESCRLVDPTGLRCAGEPAYLPQIKPTEKQAGQELLQARESFQVAKAQVEAGEREPYTLDLPRAMVEWADDYLSAARSDEEPVVGMPVQTIQLGDLAIVGTGAETFTGIGAGIRSLSPAADTVTLGYTNGCIGYLPTADEFPLGGYEVETAFKYFGTLMAAPDCERLTVEKAGELLERD